MQAPGTREQRYGVSPLAQDNERQRYEFYLLGLTGNHGEVRRRLIEAEAAVRQRILARVLAVRILTVP